MSDDVKKFVETILAPKLHLVDGVPLEDDAAYRCRIAAAAVDRMDAIEVAIGKDLDALGIMHGIIRIGLR